MVKLRCESLAERALIPAFVFFFQMLYPFAWTNRRDSTMAAAAGGCMLVRRDALEAAGGIEAIRSSLIDDCALGRSMKKQGPIWLGLTDSVHSLRPYPGLGDIRRMVSRSAYDQLNYSPLLLAGTVAGMLLTYLLPPLFAIFGSWPCAGDRRCNLGPDVTRVSADRPLLPAFAALGCGASCHRGALYGIHARFGSAALAWQRRPLERARAGAPRGGIMTAGPVWEAGEKTHRDENFPVASHLVSKQHRPPILAFYQFARAADDVADHPELSESEKIRRLDQFEETLLGKTDEIEDALPLRAAITERGLSPKHGQDLLVAFRMDASKHRYADWDDLIHYCTYSAMPVGRFVLDVHGESRATWPANDALCAALQIINHLQDCGADYRRLDRVYIPLDRLAARNIPVEALAAPKASPDLLAAIHELAAKTKDLLGTADLSRGIRDLRLSLEVAAIERLARKLVKMLMERDPFSQPVHLTKLGFAYNLITAASIALGRRLFAPGNAPAALRGIDDQPSP